MPADAEKQFGGLVPTTWRIGPQASDELDRIACRRNKGRRTCKVIARIGQAEIPRKQEALLSIVAFDSS